MFMSDREVAERYKVSPPTIWRWVKTLDGFPQPVKLSPGCTRWRSADLEAFEKAPAAEVDTPGPRRRGRPRKAVA